MKWRGRMPDEQKPRHPEINFLPPLEMILYFFNKKEQRSAVTDQEPEGTKDEVIRIIERINTDDETKTNRPGN